jgi:hypothetical protein
MRYCRIFITNYHKENYKIKGSHETFVYKLCTLSRSLTRKFAIPLLEWLDRERVTRRIGDLRVVL